MVATTQEDRVALDHTGVARFACTMADPDLGPAPELPPPLGSWAATYAIVCLLAVCMMALLWWLTAAYQIRPGTP